jgi:hypothetical protein
MNPQEGVLPGKDAQQTFFKGKQWLPSDRLTGRSPPISTIGLGMT